MRKNAPHGGEKTRVLVTGGSGFIGTNLVGSLLESGADVLSVDLAEPRDQRHRDVWLPLDLRVRDEVEERVKSFLPTHVYHLGARTDLDSDDIGAYSANTAGTKHLLDACSECSSVRRVLVASSQLVCRLGHSPRHEEDYCPTTAYGESKVKTEQIVRGYSQEPFEWLMVRPTSIWGPWFDQPYLQFFDIVRHRLFVYPKGEEIAKCFGYVGNCVFQLERLMAAPPGDVCGRTFYASDYQPVELSDFASRIARHFGVRPPMAVPGWILSLGARSGDALTHVGWKHPPLTSFRLSNIRTQEAHDLSATEAVVGPLPFSVDEGIAHTVKWMTDVESATSHAPGQDRPQARG